jgi:nucleotide-binding universal stress UspA family protein
MEATVRILLAIDGSPSSIQARDLVASLSLPSGSSLTMLTAYDIPVAWFGDPLASGAAGLPEAEEAVRREADSTLVRLAAPFSGRNWSIDRRVVRGRAPGVIVEAAADVAADLIVLGSRGQGPIASMLLGSVSAEVVERGSCSVLVARGSGVSRLLVATDGSPCAELIPDVLAMWRAFEGLPAVAVSVTPVDSPAFDLIVDLYTLGSLSVEPYRKELRERHRGHASAMAVRLSENGIPAKADVRTGDAAHEIIAAATEHHVDLIVTGSRCLHGMDRWLLGSVSRNVLLHAGVSVLIVRRSTPAAGS